jgi:ubiquitin carboxyl-terminal hydrolase 22/27/51
VIQLKRFGRNSVTAKGGNISSKLTTHVAFPSDSLSLAPFTSSYLSPRLLAGDTEDGSSRPAKLSKLLQPDYTLYAVIVHYGSLDRGHYITYVRVGGGPHWFKCDDAMVTPVALAEVLSSEAYLLFYVRERAD